MSNVSTNSTESSFRARGRVIGVPKRCWCGEGIMALTSKSDSNPYRRYYRCGFAVANKLRNDEHTFKWVDEAFVNEIDTLDAKTVELEKQLKDIRTERFELEKMVYEKMEKEIFEKVEDALDEAKSSNKRMMLIIVFLCMIMIGLSKLLG
ncbi:PREDICTED: uncharacterized protein At4g04775-like [Camelina sativa]|uniref:Uncharacterized protein At4g04775-like n=2 Tax=Camelina sativa TaxID=90675 RepID=A0ABM0VE44_CAMSA|nr:PREDICTED: uncharacterized protein At4g04775-like [Camelina sativa]XP_019082768.1 PREDICTED: uncharacterized protein At4g04775-like [Camelina sativa]XP_019086245.1 PREDICTED: uncharacterized protein At4g04775-like [Camelina sativa]